MITSFALKLHKVICQLYLSKAGGEEKKSKDSIYTMRTPHCTRYLTV